MDIQIKNLRTAFEGGKTVLRRVEGIEPMLVVN